jgi:hypothetical protein
MLTITNGATRRGSNVIVMGLAGITADTRYTANNTANQIKTISVSSTAGLRIRMLISVPTAGIVNARIEGIAGSTVTLNKSCNATLKGAALMTAGVIEGEVISIDTLDPISAARIMKVDRNEVTLDKTAGTTEFGRAISFSKPIFRARAKLDS